MAALVLPNGPLESTAAVPPAGPIRSVEISVQPATANALSWRLQGSNSDLQSTDCPTNITCPASQSPFESLPVEIVNQILSYLTHPRSRLPGLTEAQSAHDFPGAAKTAIKGREDLTTPPDTDRWAVDLFSWTSLVHPFHALALTSKRCHQLVEGFCVHKVRSCNIFNLPFAQLDKHGPQSVYPDLSGIVYRRLWLQHAPRLCVFCHAVMSSYPHRHVKRLVAACEHCFYRQTLSVEEVEKHYHISADAVHNSPDIRGFPGSVWVLRTDVEAMALQLYGTRAFHNAHREQLGKPCTICMLLPLKQTQHNLNSTQGKTTAKSGFSPRSDHQSQLLKKKKKKRNS